MQKLFIVLCLSVLTLGLCGCGSAQSSDTAADKEQKMAAFQRVSSDEELPDKAQRIFVYCRSGARSQQAAQKLANMGYTNIVEMGGIKDWHGDVVK